MPFENSSHGSVVQTLDLLCDRSEELRDIQVCGEVYIDIEHYLLGSHYGKSIDKSATPGDATPTPEAPAPEAPRSHPLVDISHIKHVYSHPQAFGQCTAFVSTYLKGAEIHDVSSTSKGAEKVAHAGEQGVELAAIASEAAVSILNLKVLAKCIQDKDDNTTRFFVIGRGRNGLVHEQSDNVGGDAGVRNAWKSLVGFGIDHTRAGALADALNAFKVYDLNLTSINSRPSQRRPWHYIFLVEFEGKVEDDGNSKADEALRSLGKYTEELRWYGSWRNRRTRA